MLSYSESIEESVELTGQNPDGKIKNKNWKNNTQRHKHTISLFWTQCSDKHITIVS